MVNRKSKPKKRVTMKVLKKRRRTAAKIILILLAAVIFFNVWKFNNYSLKTTSVSVTTKKLVSDVRVVVIGDQHATENGISNRKILKKIQKADPDLVFILGDMYTRNSSEDIMQIPVDLTRDIVESGYRTYFVPGDHDISEDYMKKLSDVGANVMTYKSETIRIRGNQIKIIGIDNVYYSPTFDLSKEFELNEKDFNILLAHIPNYEKFAEFGADLTLCADTHGGMIQLPFGWGPFIDSSNMKYFPELTGDKICYDKGFFEYDGGTMFITSGIGLSPLPARFNNRPEVVVMDIKAD